MVWTDLVRRRAKLVAVATLVIALAAAAYVAHAFAVNTNTADMLARDLPFQQANRALLQAFPQDKNTLVAVIEGDNPDLVEDGADALAAALAAEPQRFGVAELTGDKVAGIEEKPKNPKSDYAVTGIYFYDAAVFDIIRTLKPSGRGELEITDVNNAYIDRSQLSFDTLQGWWSDAGTFESLKKVNELIVKEPLQ